MANTCGRPSAVRVSRSRRPTPALWIDRVEAAETVDLLGERSRLCEAREIADGDGLAAREAAPRVLGSRRAPRVQDDRMPHLDQELARP